MIILGMAKSNLDLKGAKGPKLELDFLRLVYATQKLDGPTRCYLAVMTEDIAHSVNAWAERYEAEDVVEVVVVPLTSEELAALEDEKARNAQAAKAPEARRGADAPLGRDIGENYLMKVIEERHPEVQPWGTKPYPLGIRWDFCGLDRAQ